MSADAGFARGGAVVPVSFADLCLLAEALDVALLEIGPERYDGLWLRRSELRRFHERINTLRFALEGLEDD